ncbi:MAG TPA: SprT family zinc-dependent metalloprotease [Verrucomicrobiae bacterium]|nr:SprT family zinc-dependent metalloprotease [Verrucomicrobiae bacterium]
MPVLTDTEFGEIVVRRSAQSRHMRIRIAPDGRLRASIPVFSSLQAVKRFIANSRSNIRELVSTQSQSPIYTHGTQIGKSHSLVVMKAPKLKITTHAQKIIVGLPADTTITAPEVQTLIREQVGRALRREAKAFLPRRLAYFAQHYGFSYKKVRFSHAGSRWGSCSSSGTISLNIALMKLPHELIDYVLLHELSHTRHMNHSPAFWDTVKACDPQFQAHRRQLRAEHPYI